MEPKGEQVEKPKVNLALPADFWRLYGEIKQLGDKEIKSFLAHDLRNPLQVVMGYIQLLGAPEEVLLPNDLEKYQACRNVMKKDIDEMLPQMNNVVEILASLDSGHLASQPEMLEELNPRINIYRHLFPILMHSQSFLREPNLESYEGLKYTRISLRQLVESLQTDSHYLAGDLELNGLQAIVVLNLLKNAYKHKLPDTDFDIKFENNQIEITNYSLSAVENNDFKPLKKDDRYHYGMTITKLYSILSGVSFSYQQEQAASSITQNAEPVWKVITKIQLPKAEESKPRA